MQLRRGALPVLLLATAACYPGGILGTADGGYVIVVVLSPSSATIQTGASQRFQGSVYGTSDIGVAWSVQEPGGGSIVSDGTYTAPATAGVYHVMATSHADPTKSSTATVTATTPPGAAGLVISSPLTLDKTTVTAGDTLRGTVTYQNTSTSPIVAQAIAITSRPPGGTNAGGPYNPLTPSLAAQTIQPGAILTLAASRAFTSADPLGAWYAYTTWQDAGAVWHDGPNVNFTVVAPLPAIQVFTAMPATLIAGATSTLAATFSNGTGSIDQGVGPIASGRTATVAPSTTTTYTLTVADGLGHSATAAATVTVTPANGPPVVTITASPANPSNQTTASFSFVSTKAGSTFSCQLDSGAAAACTSPYSAPGLAAGSHTFKVTATDLGGLVSAPVSFTWTIDLTVRDVIPLARRTTWNPGIPGGIPSRTTICATINAATYGNGTTDATSAIQAAIDACPEGQAVFLPAGTYRVTSNLNIAKGIVLRGAGPALTKIRAYLTAGSVSAIYMANLWPWYGSAVNVTADVPKDATSIPVADASSFAAGDIIQIDQLDDPSYVFYGSCPWFKRPDYGPASAGPRSVGQTAEVISKSGNTLVIGTPIHLGFKLAFLPQVFKPSGPATPSGNTVKYAGLEDLYVTGGQNDQIHMINCAYCWVKNIESDGTVAAPAPDGTAGPGNGMKGAHMQISRSYRVVIRDSYFHHATNVVQGGGAYGISISEHTSDSLIENNIVYYMNKPLTMRATGGGNVVAFNYVDDAWTSADAFMMETDIDMGHASFPYMELVEGNEAPQIATDDVWGGSGWMTVFRNHASGKQRRTALHERERIAAINFEGGAVFMNVVGNALGIAGPVGTASLAQVYEVHSNPPGDVPAVWRLGSSPISAAGAGYHNQDIYDAFPWLPGTTGFTLLRQGNYDFVTNTVADGAAPGLPPSLYLSAGPPSWWGSNPWPFVDPTRTPVVGTLPAKARFDALGVPIQ
jgi:hypothetical protein